MEGWPFIARAETGIEISAQGAKGGEEKNLDGISVMLYTFLIHSCAINPAKSEQVTEITKKKMGRPKKIVDWEIFANMCRIHMSEEMIAASFGMTVDTLCLKCKEEFDGMTFQEIAKYYRAHGKRPVFEHAFKRAMKSDKVLVHVLDKIGFGADENQDKDSNFNVNIAGFDPADIVISSDGD